MTSSLKVGDRVSCRIKEGKITLAYADFDSEKDFEIISTDSRGYFLYVPDYFNIINATKITYTNIKSLKINNKFLNCGMVYISGNMISKVQSRLDGSICCKCQEFNKYAEPNQPDGTLICFNCRKYPIYLSIAHDED